MWREKPTTVRRSTACRPAGAVGTALVDPDHEFRGGTGVEAVRDLLPLDRVADGELYRIEWREHDESLTQALADAEATVLEAWGDGQWTFRVRVPDHDRLTDGPNFLTDPGIAIHIRRTYTFTDESARRRDFGLSPEQPEALVLALKRGSFATPSEVSFDDLASGLGIAKQAVSNRIRRGNEKILVPLLLSSAAD